MTVQVEDWVFYCSWFALPGSLVYCLSCNATHLAVAEMSAADVHADDVGEGVDALLSLASMAHASSSCQTDSQPQKDMGPGAYQEDDSMDYLPYGKSNAVAATAAAAALPPKGASTPKRPITSDYIYRTSTPGNPGNKTEFLVASPGYSDLAPTPRGKGRGGKGARGKGRGKGRRGGRGGAAATAEAAIGYLGDFAEAEEEEEEEGYLNALEGGVSGASGLGVGVTGGSPYRTRGNRVVIPTEVDGDFEYAPTPSSLRVGRGARREVEGYAEEQPDPAPVATAATGRASRRDKASRRAAAAAESGAAGGRGGAGYGSRHAGAKLPRLPERRKKREKAIPFTGNLKHWFHRTVGSQMGMGGMGVNGRMDGELPSRAEQTLRHCLSGRMRRWLMYEFHYSAIDRPYFLRNELQDLLQVCGCGERGGGANHMQLCMR